MSFILDALRKSEHERQRQTGPALVESAVVTPKPRTNRWATAAIALLVINLVALGVMLLIKARDEPAATTSTPQAAPPAAAPEAQTSVTQSQPATPPMMRPAAPPPENAGHNPLEEEVVADPFSPEYEAATPASSMPPGGAVVEPAAPVRRGSVVYQSLPEADPVTSPTAAAAAAAMAAEDANPASDLPRADEIAARGGSPEMRLELHVYSTRPAERIVFINSHQYREGDRTQEGATIEQITPDGVIMSMNGNRFLLPRD